MKTLKKSKITVPVFLRSRWVVGGMLAVIVVGGAGTYMGWSKSSWDSYEKKYTSLRRNIDSNLTTTFSFPSDTAQQRQEKTANLAKLSTDIEGMGDSICRQNSLISWQRVFNEYKTYEESCKATWAALEAFNGQLKLIVEYLQQEQALAKQLASAPTQPEVREDEFEAQLTAWRSVHTGIENASSGSDFELVKQVAKDATGGILKTWEEIIAAHQAKDKARYIKGVQVLAAAYDKLQAISSTNTAQLTGATTKLKEVYRKLR